jgi:TIR domain
MAVFISYSRKDRRQVEKLAGDLRELHRDAWFDAQIHGGSQWWQTILKNIQGCDLFVVALSRRWVASKACRAEYDYARKLRRTIVPVSIKRTAWRSVPASVEELQIVPYRHQDKREAFVELRRAMDDAPQPGPLPDPLPADPAPPPRDSPWRLVGAAIAAVAVLVAVIAVLLLSGGGGGGGGGGSTGGGSGTGGGNQGTRVDVPGTSQWTDTGIDVAAGDEVTITADGTVWHSPDQGSGVGPGGDPNPALAQYSLVEGSHAALLARIANGDPRVIGGGSAFTAESAGRLWLGVNDIGPDNNHGQFTAMVTVSPAGG